MLIRYLSTILQSWYMCSCCAVLHPHSQLVIASAKHALYHDTVKGELICRKCSRFEPSNDYSHCLYARYKNKLEILSVPEVLQLGFMEQRAITLSHVYMSIIAIRGHQAALKGQVVHFHVDSAVTVEEILPFPRCYEYLAVVQEKPSKNNEIRTTVAYAFSPIQVLKALHVLQQENHLYAEKKIMSMKEIEDMFQCRNENIVPIRIIDRYAYNNATTVSPVVNSVESLSGPK
jgi:hypothetical protein